MSTQDRRNKEKQQRFNQILDSAESIMLNSESDNFTIEDVAAGCSLSAGTIYLYFESKDDLIAGVAARINKQIQTEYIIPAANTGNDPLETIRNLAQAYFQFGKDHPAILQKMIQYRPKLVSLASKPTKQLMELGKTDAETQMVMNNVIEEGIAQGLLKAEMQPPLGTILILLNTQLFIENIFMLQGEVESIGGDTEDILTNFISLMETGYTIT